MTGRAPLPCWHDDLSGTLAACWGLLERGVADRRSGFHHPVISSIGLDGAPRSRVMILRGVDVAALSLRVHTDIRSEKIAEWRADPRVFILGYDAGQKLQIRLAGCVSLHHDDAIADAAWQSSRAMSRVCYGTAPAPGSEIARGDAFALPSPDDAEGLEAGRAHFAAVVMRIESLESLYLAFEGHRRALFAWDAGGALTARWLAP
ncbi:MAG: pyridoxamine 5'-phosphate oxidase family protein [Methylobacterium sp.]|jgi:pyridoxamine 5'-phosphate oxidase|nr:pyridoxamine 5'-phosphate oxidase family protein [Methylobacterium sp.]